MTTKILLHSTRDLLAGLLLLTSLGSFGQSAESANALVQSFDTYRRQALQEKLFVHTDQGFYLVGETLWFKAYYVDGSLHQPLDLSKVAYVDLLDTEQKSVLQTKVALAAGGGNGSIFLPASLNSGTYRLRAYTNWMKNFSADFFFEKKLTIVNPFKPLGLPLSPQVPDYDIQFFPEGGNLVQGLTSNVAFKVADAAGRGANMRGWVLNGQNDTLSRFTTHQFGIGMFAIKPSENTTYKVLFRDDKGRTVTRSLPAIQPQGYTMRLEDSGADQLKVTVATTLDAPSSVYLFAHTRQVIKAAEMRSIQRETTFLLDKKALGEGVSHLTIFNADRKPVCERLYFKRPAQQFTLALKPDQNQYATRAKVSIDASVLAPATKTSQAALSMAVYRVDSLAPVGSGTILSYLWMTSDLQGTIESPEYYLQPETAEIAQATDNLMLTHGWRRFRWNDVLSTQPKPVVRFIPEHNGALVQGTVTDPGTGKPMPNIQTYLSTPGKPVRLYVSRSDTAGRIKFEMQDFYGPKTLIVQTNPVDSLTKLTINSPFADAPPAKPLPEPAITEAQADQLLNRSVAMQVQSTYWGDRAIQYSYPAVDSAAFYGPPSESYLLDVYTRFPRMEEVLREYVLGVMPRKRQGHFRLNVLNGPYRAIFENEPLVLMDGVPVFDMDKVIEFSPLKIKQLDVVTNYYYLSPFLFHGIISFMTYKGDLAGFPLDTRLVKVDYDGLQLQREFYAPRYDRTPTKQTSRLPDARTLLYWNPSLQTNTQGKGRVEFYTSDQTGTYLVEVNGLTKDGIAGSQRVMFTVLNTPK
ncbi:Plug domain-containing protein [Spirosoma migulaei]